VMAEACTCSCKKKKNGGVMYERVSQARVRVLHTTAVRKRFLQINAVVPSVRRGGADKVDVDVWSARVSRFVVAFVRYSHPAC
jgi:hypothetical protein